MVGFAALYPLRRYSLAEADASAVETDHTVRGLARKRAIARPRSALSRGCSNEALAVATNASEALLWPAFSQQI
jgi:hypothetical protein